MKHLLFGFMLISSSITFAAPLEAPSIRVVLDIKESNESEVRDRLEKKFNEAYNECDDKAEGVWFKSRRREFERECKQTARDNQRKEYSDQVAINTIKVLSTENESDGADFQELLKDKRNHDLYENMNKLRDLAKDEDIKEKVRELQELSGEKVSFKLSADIVNDVFVSSSSKVRLVFGESKRIIYGILSISGILLTDFNDYYNDGFYGSDVEEEATVVTDKERVIAAIEDEIKALKDEETKRNNLDSIMNDFSSVEEENGNRFI